MFNINDISGQCGEAVDYAGKFLPYAHKKLGFNKPVGVNFVSDPKNAKNPLGNTAYYDPGKMEITIFVDKRHVKDILRSLSHELIHHTQNCRGEFDKQVDTSAGYAQKDPHMRKMEAEAYLLGNGFLFRDWEDHLKLKENRTMASKAKPDYIDYDGDGDRKESMKKAVSDKKRGISEDSVVDEGIFAPSHYCAHHGGVQMEGKMKLGKVIAHNWNTKLQKVTKYDMQFEDGTILEGVKAEDLYVTEASLAEAHHGHEAKKDEKELEENETALSEGEGDIKIEYDKLPLRLKALADKAGMGGAGKEYHVVNASDNAAAMRELEKRFHAKIRSKEKKGDQGQANENWTRNNKDNLLFERLVKKWAK